MSGFMRQLKQTNESNFKRNKTKQSVKFNQGSVVMLNSTQQRTAPQRCASDCKLVANTPNYPRSINKLSASFCHDNFKQNCDPQHHKFKKTNISNRKLAEQRVNTRTNYPGNCNKNIKKQYFTNGDLIDQVTSENLKRNTVVRPLVKDDCYGENGCGYSNYGRGDVLRQFKQDRDRGLDKDCNNCDIKRTVDESMRQYRRCDNIKNIDTLDNSDYIALYRAGLVSNNNLPTPKITGDKGRCPKLCP